MRKFYNIVFFLLLSGVAYSQDGPWDDKIICGDESITIGDGGSDGACYSWMASPEDPSVKNAKSPTISVSPKQPTTYTRTTIGQDFSFTKTDQVKVLILTGFTISLLQNFGCDGQDVDIKLVPIPSEIPANNFLMCLNNLQFIYKTMVTSLGNPEESTTLQFSELSIVNGHVQSTIRRPLWYSTEPDHCNDESSYEIDAKINNGAKTINSANKEILTVIANIPSGCLSGGIIDSTKQYFSGSPKITTQKLGNGKYQAFIEQGTFIRNVRAEYYNYTYKQSQYYNMVEQEERFHQGQYEGTTSSIYLDLWIAEKVLKDAQSGTYIGVSEQDAINQANLAFIEAENNEIEISNVIRESRGCQAEKEAKLAAGSSYRVSLYCTYRDCQ